MNEFKVSSVLVAGEKYGLEIMKAIKEEAGTTILLGSLYSTLDSLEKKGFVSSRWEISPDKGKPRKFYKLTAEGKRAFEEESTALLTLIGIGARI